MDTEETLIIGEEEPDPFGEKPGKKPYAKAELMVHGDLREITGRPS